MEWMKWNIWIFKASWEDIKTRMDKTRPFETIDTYISTAFLDILLLGPKSSESAASGK